jgi:membrane protease subunit (stomatin/prohibitin family)
MMRRRRPLLRAAMVGGTAYAVGKHAQRGQNREDDQEARLEQLESQQYSQQQPMAPTGGPTDIAANLAQLKGLLDQGALTQAEFDAAKQKLLAG